MALVVNGDGPITGVSNVTFTGAGTIAGLASGAIPSSKIGTGAILQSVSNTYSTQVSSSSTTWVSTGLTASITPVSLSSRILVAVYCPIRMGSTNNISAGIRINRGGTVVFTDTVVNNVNSIVDISYPICFLYVDSPSTSNAVTYTIEFNCSVNASPYVYPTVNYTGYPHLSTLNLFEIA